jgi:hypothetical protein
MTLESIICSLRGRTKAVRKSMTGTMQAGKPSNAADRTDAMVKMMSARLESHEIDSRHRQGPLRCADRRPAADQLLGGPMMGMGSSMMGMDGRTTMRPNNDAKP